MTNQQFAAFIATGGYRDRQWWSNEGRAWLEREKAAEPLYWHDRRWNAPFEADFQPGSFGYRPKRTAHDAIKRVADAIANGRRASSTLTCEPTLTMSGTTGCWKKWYSGLMTRKSCIF